jgi:hypothetical protein
MMISIDHGVMNSPIWAALVACISQYCPYLLLSSMIHFGSFSTMMSLVPGDLYCMRYFVSAPYPAPSSTIVLAHAISAIAITRRASQRDDPREYPISDQNLRVQNLRFIVVQKSIDIVSILLKMQIFLFHCIYQSRKYLKNKNFEAEKFFR